MSKRLPREGTDMPRRPKVLFAAGGTGGHIFPALAVARELRSRRDDVDIAFVGSGRRLEAELVPNAGFRFISVTAAGFPSGLTHRWAAALAKLAASTLQVARLLIRERPSVAFGTGGFVCGPLIAAAALSGIPTVIHECNSVAGLTNRWLGRLVREAHVGFEDAAAQFPARRVHVTGNPIRQEIVDACRSGDGRTRIDGRLSVLVMGGSLGSRRINEAVIEALPELAQMPIRLVHQTGEHEYDTVEAAYGRFFEFGDASAADRFELLPFIDDPGQRLAVADLLVCRSGAMTISEAMFCGIPCIMVPFPHAIRDEQRRNAAPVVAAGAGVLIEDSELDGPRVIAELSPFVESPGRLATAAASCAKVARPNATVELADALERYLG